MKRSRKSAGCAALAMVATSLLAAPAHADAAGQELLVTMDANSSMAQDLQMDYEVLNEIPGKPTRTMRLHVKLKGEKRFTEFLAPGDLKGTRVLSHTRTRMWVYLPAYQKVRRVASHATQQGFMGTTFTQDDMAIQRYAPVFEASILKETEGSTTVKVVPREGVETAYGHLEMDLRKGDRLPTQIRYFNRKGQHVKTQIRTGYSCEKGVCNPGTLKMVDHTRGDATTTMTRLRWKVNAGIPDKIFSVRNLQRR